MADKFFRWYGEVFKKCTLSVREKSLVALDVAHAVQYLYCIDACNTDLFERGWCESHMMEAVHVADTIKGGAALVHGVQMINKVKEIDM